LSPKKSYKIYYGEFIMASDTQTSIEAAVFRRLLAHLDNHKDVQNIDLMNLANFCRNCLSKWYVAAAESNHTSIEYEQAREIVYGMPYSEWKEKHQPPATERQLKAFSERQF
jgi:hypothetical protein